MTNNNLIDIKQRAKQVLQKGYLLSLGTYDENGPWVADIIYVSDDDFTLYWMSNPNFRHSQAVTKNPKVAGTITVSQKFGIPDFGLQLEGNVKKLDVLGVNLAIKYLKKLGRPVPAKVLNILRKSYSWYELKPTTIELIDEINFGFEKQKINLS